LDDDGLDCSGAENEYKTISPFFNNKNNNDDDEVINDNDNDCN